MDRALYRRRPRNEGFESGPKVPYVGAVVGLLDHLKRIRNGWVEYVGSQTKIVIHQKPHHGRRKFWE